MELFPRLPTDLGRQCLLRVSYESHRNLAAVCRSWKATLRSPDFYQNRKILGTSQQVICLFELREYRHNYHLEFVVTVFDPLQHTWETLPPLPHFPGYHDHGIPLFCDAISVNQKLVLMGGFTRSHNILKTVFIYDFSSAKWSRGADMPTARKSPAFSVSPEGLVYRAGGTDNDENALRGSEVYNVEEDEWKLLPDMNQERATCSAVFYDGKVFVTDLIDGEDTDFMEPSGEVTDLIDGEDIDLMEPSGEDTDLIDGEDTDTDLMEPSGEDTDLIDGEDTDTDLMEPSGEDTDLIDGEDTDTDLMEPSGEDTDLIDEEDTDTDLMEPTGEEPSGEVYDPKTGAWTTIQKQEIPKFFVVDLIEPSTELYNPKRGGWTTIQKEEIPPLDCTIASSDGARFFLVEKQKGVMEYDSKENGWRAVCSLPETLKRHDRVPKITSFFAWRDRIFVSGYSDATLRDEVFYMLKPPPLGSAEGAQRENIGKWEAVERRQHSHVDYAHGIEFAVTVEI